MALYVGKASVELHEVGVLFFEAAAHVDREDCHHHLHLGDHGAGGHKIDLVSGYQVSRSFPRGAARAGCT